MKWEYREEKLDNLIGKTIVSYNWDKSIILSSFYIKRYEWDSTWDSYKFYGYYKSFDPHTGKIKDIHDEFSASMENYSWELTFGNAEFLSPDEAKLWNLS
jgi:hypothetical protein